VLNCRDHTVETFDRIWANPGTRLWNGGVLAPNGTIFGVPSSATKVLALNTQTRAMQIFGELESGASKWSGGVLGPDKRTIFFVPSNAEFVLAVDSETWKVREFGYKESELVALPIKGDLKWCGGALGPDNRTIFCIPSSQMSILAIDTVEFSVEEFGDLPEGNAKWSGIVLGADKKTLYGIPLNSESVLALNMEDRTIDFFAYLPGKRKWKGGVLGPDGMIYAIPAGHQCVLQIDPVAKKALTIPGGFAGEPFWPGWKWSGGILHPGTGTIFCTPTNSHTVLAIGPIKDLNATYEDEFGNVMKVHESQELPALESTMQTSQRFRESSPTLSPKESALDTFARDTPGLLAASLLKSGNQALFKSGKQRRGEIRQMSQSASLPKLPGSDGLSRVSTTGGRGAISRSVSAAALPNMTQGRFR
jgi:hypothetical protein